MIFQGLIGEVSSLAGLPKEKADAEKSFSKKGEIDVR